MDSNREIKILKEFGRKLKKLRIERNMSTRELADLADMSYTHLSNIENGKVNPQLITIISIGQALEIDPYTLLVGLK